MIGLCVFKVRKTSWEAHLEHLSHVQWVEATKMRRLAAWCSQHHRMTSIAASNLQ